MPITDHERAWVESMTRRGLAAGTISKRRYELHSWGRWIGERWADDAGWRDVEAWLASRPLGPRAMMSANGHVRAFYRWARREGLTETDPCRDVETPRLPRRLPRPASERTVRRAVGAGLERCELACALMAHAGLRCIEVARLDWRDIDLPGGHLRVIGKGDKERAVPIVAPLAAMLAAGDGLKGPVMPTTDGRHLSAVRVSQLVNAHLQRRGAGATAHQLRHYAATRMLDRADGDLLVVRDFLGHATVAQTEVYAQLAAGRLDRAAARW